MSQKPLRTPTNMILIAMAISEMMTGLVSLPWLMFYYSFDGYKTDARYGIPKLWCEVQTLLAYNLPSMCHTAAVWLTTYLAVHRYFYVRRSGQNFCCRHHNSVFYTILIICFGAILFELPKLLTLLQKSENKQFSIFSSI